MYIQNVYGELQCQLTTKKLFKNHTHTHRHTHMTCTHTHTHTHQQTQLCFTHTHTHWQTQLCSTHTHTHKRDKAEVIKSALSSAFYCDILTRTCWRWQGHTDKDLTIRTNDKHTDRTSQQGHTTRTYRQGPTHTPSITFWQLPPNSGRIGYTTEGSRFISAQLSTDGQHPPKGLGTNKTVKAT